MERIVIFDFNRTLFDPEKKGLLTCAKDLLSDLRKKGYGLLLLSHGQADKALVDRLGIRGYFEEIILSRAKSKKDFEKAIGNRQIDLKESFVVGDRIKKEVRIGNELGFKTIWLRRGKFDSELPKKANEEPNFVIGELAEVTNIIQ